MPVPYAVIPCVTASAKAHGINVACDQIIYSGIQMSIAEALNCEMPSTLLRALHPRRNAAPSGATQGCVDALGDREQRGVQRSARPRSSQAEATDQQIKVASSPQRRRPPRRGYRERATRTL